MLWLCFALQARSQQVIKVRFEPKNDLLQKKYPAPILLDSAQLESFITNIQVQCYAASYLHVSIGLNQVGEDTLQLLVQTGPAYVLRELTQGNVPNEWISESGYRLPVKKNQRFNPSEIEAGMKLLLSFAENNGYPFASIALDSVAADSNGIQAALNLNKNTRIYFDSIDFGGDAKIKKTFLAQYAGIKPGMPYQENLLKPLDAKLSELPYVQVARPMGIYFYGNKAKPYVYLNNRKASSFDGVIGFAPNSSLGNKLVITGDVNLKLENIAGSGKSLELAYKGYLNNSQDLRVRFIWPYFLNSKLGVDYSFRLNKFDSSWLEIFQDVGLQYRFTGNNYLKVFYQLKQIQVMNIDTQFVKDFGALPSIHDIRSGLYGLALRKSTLNYFFNPSKGYLLETDMALGNRRIVRNQSLENLTLSKGGIIYDSIQMNTLQYRASLNLSVYKKFIKHFVLLSQVNGGVVQSPNLFLNELFRIGGLKTLKGFDEQRIFASSYLIVNLEWRYVFQQNSNLLLFWNGAYYRNDVKGINISDKPWGIGAGINLETGAGVFSLYYAIGSEKGNPLELRAAKIHFGLLNYF